MQEERIISLGFSFRVNAHIGIKSLVDINSLPSKQLNSYLVVFNSLSCFLRYASKLSTCVTLPSLTTHASFATSLTKNWSCDTQITAPLKDLTLSANAATDSKSRLFVYER